MTRALLTTWGRNILPAPNRSPTDVHAGHQRAFDDLDRLGRGKPGFLGVLDDEGVDALHEGVRSRSETGSSRQARSASARTAVPPPAYFGGDLEQPLGGVRPAVQDHVLDALEQLGRDLGVDGQLARIDDAHVHAGGDGVVQEDGVDRLADGVVAAEGERDVADAAADPHVRASRP